MSRCLPVLLLGLGAALPALAAEDLGEAVRRTFEGGDFQTERPGVAGAPGPEGDREAFLRLPRPGVVSGIAEVLLWALTAVAVTLGVLWLVQRLGAPAEAGFDEEPERAPPGETRPISRPLGDAEALAREGRYGEAVHVLLLRTLQALDRRERLLPSLTSREVVAGLEAGAGVKNALEGLVGEVERSLFGGREPGREAYDACVDRYRHLEAALAGPGA